MFSFSLDPPHTHTLFFFRVYFAMVTMVGVVVVAMVAVVAVVAVVAAGDGLVNGVVRC